jgi:prepilin-type N-terminal cleavage/methylation domain-containing protein/prepilin-type processing-associated H-X9-DG protein
MVLMLVNSMRKRISCGKGFTLVELLIVVGIIAILASLLLPAMGKAKQKGESVRCQNNLRHISLIHRMAINDDEVRLATGIIRQDSGAFWKSEHGAGGEWICPSAPIRTKEFKGDWYPQGLGVVPGSVFWAWSYEPVTEDGRALPKRSGSYTYSGWVLYPDAEEADRPPMSAFAWGDGSWPWGNTFAGPEIFKARFMDSRGFSMPRHGSRPLRPIPEGEFIQVKGKLPGAINAVFMDGHVEQVPLENLWKVIWSPGYVAPNGWGPEN